MLPPPSEELKVLQLAGDPSAPNSTAPTHFSVLVRRLLDETADLVESPTFTQVLTGLLDAGFSLLVDENIAVQAFKLPPMTDPDARMVELPDPNAKTKLATVLAVMTRQAHLIGNGVPNHYLQAMDQVGDLEAFAAVVYSSNFDSEIPETGNLNEPALSNTDGSVETLQKESISFADASVIAPPMLASNMSDFESAWDKATAQGDSLAQ